MTLALIALMVAGMLTGRLLPDRRAFHAFADILLKLSIFALLFLLGVEVGANESVFANLHTIGYEAVLLTGGAIAGCGLCARLLGRFVRL